MNEQEHLSYIRLPPLTAFAHHQSSGLPPATASEDLSFVASPGEVPRGNLPFRLPSVNTILKNINQAEFAQRNIRSPEYGVSHVRPGFGHSYSPKKIDIGGGFKYRTSHVRSLSLSDFQFASTVSQRSRSFSFSYMPMQLHPPKDTPLAPQRPRAFVDHAPVAPPTVGKKRGRKKKSDVKCGQCASENTPEWRRGPNGSRTLCNACGLFYSKLTKKFGTEDANLIFAHKKKRNEVMDRIVPTSMQKDRIVLEQKNNE